MPTPRKSTDRYGLTKNGRSKEPFEFAQLSTEELGEFIAAVLSMGDAVLFGVTQDESAVRVMLMSGDERVSEYFGTPNALIAWTRGISQHIANNHS